MDRIGYRIGATVAASATDEEYTAPVEEDGTITRVSLRFYHGPENDLQIRPMIRRPSGTGAYTYRDLLTYADNGKQYVDGDDDRFSWALRRKVRAGEELVARVTNADATNDFDFAMDVEVDGAEFASRFS